MKTFLQFAEIFGNKHTTASFLVQRNQELFNQIITYKHIDKLNLDRKQGVFFVDSFDITREPKGVVKELFSDLSRHPDCLLVITMNDPQALNYELNNLIWPDNIWVGMKVGNIGEDFSFESILTSPDRKSVVYGKRAD